MKRLEDDLQCERQNMVNEGNLRENAELKLRELELKFENQSLTMSSNGRKLIEKLECKLKSLEENLDQEKRKCRESNKFSKQMERNYKDMEYQYFQEKKNFEKLEVHFLISYSLNKFLSFTGNAIKTARKK